MSQDLNKSIAQELDEALTSAGLSKEQKKKIGEDLAAAMYLNLLDRLYKELPDETKEDFIKNVPDDPQKTVTYFKKFLSNEKLEELVKSSAREVFDKFIDRL